LVAFPVYNYSDFVNSSVSGTVL